MTLTELAGSSWVDRAGSISGIVSSAIAVLAVLTGIWVSGTPYQTLALLSRRRRHIGSAVRMAGICDSRWRFARTCIVLLRRQIRRGPGPVREELAWLGDLKPARRTEDGLSPSYPVLVPFTFAIAAAAYSSALAGLAAGYEAYASSLRRRWLLRSAAGPLVAEEYERARATAALLSRWASFEPVPERADPAMMRGRRVELTGGQRSTRLVTWPDMAAARATPGFDLVGVSYQPYRVVMAGEGPGPGARLDLVLARDAAVAVRERARCRGTGADQTRGEGLRYGVSAGHGHWQVPNVAV
jgi:hypothetical protein